MNLITPLAFRTFKIYKLIQIEYDLEKQVFFSVLYRFPSQFNTKRRYWLIIQVHGLIFGKYNVVASEFDKEKEI